MAALSPDVRRGSSVIELQEYSYTHPRTISDEVLSPLPPYNEGIEGTERNAVVQQLKPADGGLEAWKVLTAAFLFEALLWGKSLSLSIYFLRVFSFCSV